VQQRLFFPKNKGLNSIIDEMTSVHLRAMKEPSLWRLSQKDRQANAYRFPWLHRGRNQIYVRLTRTGRAFALHVAGHDGFPGTTAGRPTISKDIEPTDQQENRLVGLLARTAFSASPVEVKESRGIADGDVIVIDGVEDGKYHVIERAGLATGESYKKFCRSLLELADEPDMLKEWDRLRQAERRSPRYRPEPPQTEDRGDPVPDADAP
jgi:bifunctional DNA-binding transcriptional regulator/antitoxin component of YhaV-PrlF toxin-antitoxin module